VTGRGTQTLPSASAVSPPRGRARIGSARSGPRILRAAALAALLVVAVPVLAISPEVSPPPLPPVPPPTSFVAQDRPGDGGGAIRLTWKDPSELPAGGMIEVLRSQAPAYEWETVAAVKPGVQEYDDPTVEDGTPYRYEIRVAAPMDSTTRTARVSPPVVSDAVSSTDNWFYGGRGNSLIASILFVIIVLGSIAWARSGREIFIRRISGLNAVDEAIGRATEIGKKVYYIPGIMSMDDIQTIASIAILGFVARSTARYGTDLNVPNKDPITFASAQEAVRGAYLAEGRPDLYKDEMVNYVTYDQFAYTAAVSASMVREKPAAIFLIGYFFAESLILAETGQSTGAIQIAGQADPTQLPFFVATCDYVLIGEELYAASAYLSREPVLLGSTRGQDIAKAILILLAIAGIVLASFGNTLLPTLMRTR
jgi:hypothetical protein